jgi:hypothetical protein
MCSNTGMKRLSDNVGGFRRPKPEVVAQVRLLRFLNRPAADTGKPVLGPSEVPHRRSRFNFRGIYASIGR